MTRGLGIRQYRACARCRARKTRCDLQSSGEPGKPPCLKCIREGSECVLAGSKRGGNFSHYRRSQTQSAKRPQQQNDCPTIDSDDIVRPGHNLPEDNPQPRSSPVRDHLQNPSDALLILANAAGNPADNSIRSPASSHTDNVSRSERDATAAPVAGPAARHDHGLVLSMQTNIERRPPGSGMVHAKNKTWENYKLIQDGTLTSSLLFRLLKQYTENYHCFMPIAPENVLQPDHIQDTVQHESFLLTAILVIASKDCPDVTSAHDSIWTYMKSLILNVVLGMPSIRSVGCVEGLLLLGEWTLLHHGQDGGEVAAWSILGLGVRLAYLLRLEDSGFKVRHEQLSDTIQRRRLAWTFTYLCDRQISIRMGQAFWCRGPSLSVRFTAQDFPSLKPHRGQPEDFATLLQAQVELTTLFGNVHDILYASRSRTAELMTRGDYTKYIDDAIRAMKAWEQTWDPGMILVSPHLRTSLTLTYHYLVLYVNAFAFQAVLYRSTSQGEAERQTRASVLYPDSIMASPDARHIYAAITAAETVLKIFTRDLDPIKHIRYLPVRFYLYEIHSAVFLYKAQSEEAVESDKQAETTTLVQIFISVLLAAAVNEDHIAARYARLLQRLWTTPRKTSNCEPYSLGTIFHNGPMSTIDPVGLGGWGLGGDQLSMFDDNTLLQFDCADQFGAPFITTPDLSGVGIDMLI